jgi:hypothetical protein
MIKLYPVEIEAYEDGNPAFKVTAQDEFCAEVEISLGQSADSWPAMSAAIQEALEMLKLGGEKR